LKTLESISCNPYGRSSRIDISPEARRFAVRELGIRAGLDLSGCEIEISDRQTSLRLGRLGPIRVIFPHTVRAFERQSYPTARCEWGSYVNERVLKLIPDFIVPYCGTFKSDRQPLFTSQEGTISCAVDLPASVLFSLCRIEERLSSERDLHGRFPANASLAVLEDYLHRPIVDEYGLGLAAAIQEAVPAWKPRARHFRAIVTQDVDSVGIPFRTKLTARRLIRERHLVSAFQDVGSLLRLTHPSELAAVRYISDFARSHKISSACFWKSSIRGTYDAGYDLRRRPVSTVLSELRNQGVEMGVHPSYGSFANRRELTREVELLRKWLGQSLVGGRQHYLRWQPDSWSDLESCGLTYDSSVGFPERLGFRAGTAIPYRPWLMNENRQPRIVEIPLILMDRTVSNYLGLPASEVLALAADLIARTEMVGGVFTMLWHNSLVLDPDYRALFEALVSRVASAAPFDWATELAGV
jgi:hypothetical protein